MSATSEDTAPVLGGARLTLRPIVHGDAGAIVRGVGSYAVSQWLAVVPHPYDLADAHAFIAGLHAAPEPGGADFAIDVAGEGLVGCITLARELGYWLREDFWGRGLMTEAAHLLLDWHFAHRPFDLVNSGAFEGNAASLGVQRKLGFVVTGRSRRHSLARGVDLPHVDTELTSAAYRAARAQG